SFLTKEIVRPINLALMIDCSPAIINCELSQCW
ncbi:MAG: hypothetical protein ACI9LU_002864, partial [Polaribacter sp.]